MIALTALAILGAGAGSQAFLSTLIPQPSKAVRGLGSFTFNESTRFAGTGPARRAGEQVRSMISRATEFELPWGSAEGTNVVALQLQPNLAHLGAEGYAMEVSPARIRIEAPTEAGLFYATQTLRQLLPDALELSRPPRSTSWTIPAVAIEDSPRFPWRGLHLDVSRHFFPKSDIKRYIDYLALLKMNVFHWHLVDDGGWRIEIKKYPRLTGVGAWRKAMEETWAQGKIEFPEPSDRSERYGGYYTQADVKEIVAYAAARHITVVPEIEMPGHSMPAMAAYPEVTCTYFAQTVWKISTGMRHSTNYCPGKERTFAFLEDVLDEVLALFPSKVIHIGGDEVNKLQWNKCSDCAARMAAEQLDSPEALQSWFLKRIEKYLNGKGRAMMGWDEILEGGLAPNAMVMSWRGIDGGIAAAKSGHDVVMTPTSHCYFDYSYQSISTRNAFEYEPIPPALTEEEGRRVQGAQANVWTEWMPTWEKVETMIFPRLLGMAERLWAPKSARDTEAFLERADRFLGRLDAIGAAYYLPVPRPNYAALVFSDRATLSFADSPIPGAVVRYTLDGQVPTAASPVFAAPLELDRTVTVTAAAFAPGGRASDPVAVPCVRFVPLSSEGLEAGLNLRRGEGVWDRVPDLSALPPQPVRSIDAGPYAGGDQYALEWSGFVRIPSAGDYTFQLGSDDGSVLWLAGVKIVDNDGLHGYVEKPGRITLQAGVYPFKLGFFERDGADRLTLSVEGPQRAKGPIPAEWLFRKG